MKSNMTYHAMNDRKNRLEYIIDTIGIGNEIASSPSRDDPRVSRILTDTGVIIVTNRETKKLVTAYIATINQGVSVYTQGHGVNKAPAWVMKILQKNKQVRLGQPAA